MDFVQLVGGVCVHLRNNLALIQEHAGDFTTGVLFTTTLRYPPSSSSRERESRRANHMHAKETCTRLETFTLNYVRLDLILLNE